MKKILYVVAAFAALMVTSCGNKTNGAATCQDSLCDSVVVEDTLVEAVDSVNADSICLD